MYWFYNGVCFCFFLFSSLCTRFRVDHLLGIYDLHSWYLNIRKINLRNFHLSSEFGKPTKTKKNAKIYEKSVWLHLFFIFLMTQNETIVVTWNFRRVLLLTVNKRDEILKICNTILVIFMIVFQKYYTLRLETFNNLLRILLFLSPIGKKTF